MISTTAFGNINPKTIKRVPFSEQDKHNIDQFYEKYKKEANILSLQDFQAIIKNISAELNCPKDEVLKAMQQITQFANMESLDIIAQNLMKHKIFAIGNRYHDLASHIRTKTNDEQFIHCFSDDSGLPISLTYLIEEKGLIKKDRLDEYNNADNMSIFLDKNKIKEFERLKKINPKLFNKFIKENYMKYFYISGWDTGITVLDKNKDLKTATKKLIQKTKLCKMPVEEILDKQYLDRIKALGINPIIIKNEGLINETSVYNQLKNYTISKNELYNLIEANSLTKNKSSKMNTACIDYLDKNMHIYTPENLASSLELMHSKLLKRARENGIPEKDIIYVVPDLYYRGHAKSFNMLNYSYEKVNNINHDKFQTINSLKKNKLNDKMLVFLDDCSLSGNSIEEVLDSSVKDLNEITPKYIVFASILGTKKAKTTVFLTLKDLDLKGSVLNLDTVSCPQRNLLQNRKLVKTVGKPQFRDGNDSYCIIFPYMSPDNNSEFATNLALEHNYYYRHNGPSKKPKHNYHGIKNVTQSVIDIANKKKALTGYKPIQVDTPEENFSFLDYLKKLFSKNT